MNNKILVATLLSIFLSISVFAPAFAPQPPIDSTTFLIGTIPGVIYRIDPHSAYDTASATVDMNVYDTLIWFDRDTSQPDPRNQGLTGEFIPKLAKEVPSEANGKIVKVYLDIWYLAALNQSNPFFTEWWDETHTHQYVMFDWIDNTADGTLTPMDIVYVEEVVGGTPVPCTTHAWSVVIKEHDIPPYPNPNVHLQLKRTVYYFELRTDARIQPWIDQNGVVHSTDASPDYITPADCEYSFESGMITNIAGGPMFMFYLPMFDQMTLAYWNQPLGYGVYCSDKYEYYGFTGFDQNEIRKYGARMMDCNVESNATHFWLSLGLPFPLVAWFQIVAQSWGSIVPKAFMLDHGCWNGTWVSSVTGEAIWRRWRRWPDNYMSPLDMAPATDVPVAIGGVPTTKYSNHPTYHDNSDGFDMHGEHIACGSGPYKFTYYDDVLDEWRLDRFVACWQGWAPDAIHPYYLDTIITTGISAWNVRRAGFLAGDFDSVAVNRDVMHTIMQEVPPGSGHWEPLPGLVTYADLPALTTESFHYNYAVVDGSPYNPVIAGQNMSTFFANEHARKAFSYALNFTTYIADAWLGEAARSTTWYVAGLSPDYRLSPAELTPYDLDVAEVTAHLGAAVYHIGANYYSLLNSTWSLPLLYNSGSTVREKPLSMIKDVIETAVANAGQGGSAALTLVPIDWDTFNENIYSMVMPTFLVGWLVDYAHPDDWVRPYMHSVGDFSGFQGYSNATVDYEITLAMKTDNETQRQELYEDLQREFIRECLTLILAQPTGRAWMRTWLQGWYYNPILPGAYYRDRWKGFRGDLNRDLVVDVFDLVIVAAQFGRPPPPIDDPRADVNGDGVVDIFDIVIIAAEFGSG